MNFYPPTHGRPGPLSARLEGLAAFLRTHRKLVAVFQERIPQVARLFVDTWSPHINEGSNVLLGFVPRRSPLLSCFSNKRVKLIGLIDRANLLNPFRERRRYTLSASASGAVMGCVALLTFEIFADCHG